MIHHESDFAGKHEQGMRNLSKSNKDNGLYFPGSLEAQVVRVADDLAQRIHDLEDGLRSKIITKDDIARIVRDFIDSIPSKIYNINTVHEGAHLEHTKYGTKVSKVFLDDIVAMYLSDSPEKQFAHKIYTGVEVQVVDKINDRLQKDESYKTCFLRVGIISFLLHMWRDDRHLDSMEAEDQNTARARILKYLRLLDSILNTLPMDIDSAPSLNTPFRKIKPPAYHYVAFLRGIMLANIIEHSFCTIHKLLDPDFREYDRSFPVKRENYFKMLEDKEAQKTFLIAFRIVDGLAYYEECDKLKYLETSELDHGNYCFKFNSSDEVDNWEEKYLQQVLSSNGSILRTMHDAHSIKKLSWLNKSTDVDATGFIVINDGEQCLPIENVRVYFTGYKELCPGNDKCEYAKSENLSKAAKCPRNEKCTFYTENIKYPDISRLVVLQEHAKELDSRLNGLIKNKLHVNSRISRMNAMGSKVIWFLLDWYYKNPRTMHDRVWTRLRTYPMKPRVSHVVSKWITKPITEKDSCTIPQEVLEKLVGEKTPEQEANRYSLVRRIIEHIAGMTDRYIANEYNRANQCGREVESQDETYFFS